MRWSLLPLLLLAVLVGSSCEPPTGWIPDPVPAPEPSPPGDMEVSLSPAEPTSADNIMVQVIRAAVDPDGDIEGTHYSWWVDGLHLEGLDDAAAVLAEQTSRGETWEVRALAYDSTGLLGPETSAQVVIGNSAPSAAVLALEPQEPAAGIDSLRCVVSEAAEDADGDPLTYSFRWTVDGLPYPDADPAWTGPITTTWDGDTVPAEDTAPLQHWVCAVRASDGLVEGTESEAEVTLAESEAQPDFALVDVNLTSPSFGSAVSPRDYLEKVSGWYFGHAT